MLRRLVVKNERKERLAIDLSRPSDSGYIVKSISGLGPVEASISTNEYAALDGAQFTGARTSYRNIVIDLMYYSGSNRTIEQCRQMTYYYFPVKDKITLEFDIDAKKFEIDGYVESNEINIFSQEEGSSISIICPNPYFTSDIDNSSSIEDFSALTPNFTFPFMNDSLTADLIEMGIIHNNGHLYSVFYYDGDYNDGIKLELEFDREATVNNIKLNHYAQKGNKMILIDKLNIPNFVIPSFGHIANVDTRINHKNAYFGVTPDNDNPINIGFFNSLLSDNGYSNWTVPIFKGINVYDLSPINVSNGSFVGGSISWKTYYGGI